MRKVSAALALGIALLAGLFWFTAGPASAWCRFICPPGTPFTANGAGLWGMGANCTEARQSAINNALGTVGCDVCRIGEVRDVPGGECREKPGMPGVFVNDVEVDYQCGTEFCRDPIEQQM